MGKPLLEYLIEHLARHGVKEIMMSMWRSIITRLKTTLVMVTVGALRSGYSYEGGRDHGDIVPKALGSAGGMRKIQDFGGFFDETTLVLCGDAIVDLDIQAALEEHKAKGRKFG